MTDDTIKKILIDHPKAIVVNLGAGLITTFNRVDNGLMNPEIPVSFLG